MRARRVDKEATCLPLILPIDEKNTTAQRTRLLVFSRQHSVHGVVIVAGERFFSRASVFLQLRKAENKEKRNFLPLHGDACFCPSLVARGKKSRFSSRRNRLNAGCACFLFFCFTARRPCVRHRSHFRNPWHSFRRRIL